MCSFHGRLKEAIDEHNSHTVNVGRDTVGNQWLYANHYSSHWTKVGVDSGAERKANSGHMRTGFMFLGPVLLCTFLWLPRKQQCLLLVLQQDWARQFPGKLCVAQKSPPKFHILLTFPKVYMAAKRIWSLGTSGSDQLHVAASLWDLLSSWMVWSWDSAWSPAPGQPTMLFNRKCAEKRWFFFRSSCQKGGTLESLMWGHVILWGNVAVVRAEWKLEPRHCHLEDVCS